MPYVFDFQNTLIEVTYPQVEVDIQDLINEIRTAEAEIVPGINFPKIANASGKETLTTVSGGTISVGITVDLQNGWQLHFWPSGYVATIAGGNLVGGPAGDPVAYSADVQVLLVQSASATLVTTAGGSGGLDQEEHDQLMGLPDEDTIVSGVWDESLTALTHNIPTSAGRRLRSLEDAVEAYVDDPSPTVSGFITSLISNVDDFYSNQTIHFIEGDLDGQTRIVVTYNGTTKYATFDEHWTSAPADGDDFHIHATHLHPVSEISEGVWNYATRTLTSFEPLQTSIEDALGLTGENTRWSGMAFDSNNYLISAVITHYTDNTLSVEREKWQLTASYDSEGRITNYEFKEY